MLNPKTYYVILFLVSLYAFLQGRSDERVTASICILATFATNIVYTPPGSYAGVETGILLVDLAAFAAFLFLALRSDRFWPLWVAGLQLATVGAHVVKAFELDLMPQAYAAAARFWVYPIFLIIAAGTFSGARRRASCEERRILAQHAFSFGSELLLPYQRFAKRMEILARTHRATRPGGAQAVVNEYWQMVDHSPRRNGTDWLPGPKRFALATGEAVHRVDEYTFQVARTGEILRTSP